MPSDSPLDPENRALYGEILRAPPGYEVDMALATTYSLDFETALVIPATMAFQAAESRAQVLDTPLALLDGLERLAERVAIFCAAGRIAAQPRAANRLTALLEDTVTEVLAPQGGAFHPKIWVLRIVPLTGAGPVRLRLAILSRNLTTDRSWDLSLSLDGEVTEVAQADNAPITALLRALPGLARGRPTPARNRKIADALARDLDHAVWALPEGARRLRFAVNGLGQPPFRPRVGNAQGIISPFLSAEALIQLTKGLAPADCWLLSRAEELAQMPPEVLARFGQVLELDDLAETEDGEEAASAALGLHAKVFVTERYPRPESTTDLTVGSGNATAAALLNGSNVEVFATLSGPSRRMGWVADHIAPERLGRFLRPWQPPATAPAADPAVAAEARLDAVRKALAAADLTLRCATAVEDRISLTLTARSKMALPDGLRAELWPLTLGPNHALTLTAPLGRTGLHLGQFALADVTRWLGVRLTDLETGAELVFRSRLPTPADRRRRHASVSCGRRGGPRQDHGRPRRDRRTIEALWDKVPRIDIIYVCSNGAIAAQNLARLNVMEREAKVLPTRLTLLPLVLGGENSLRHNKVNFISLTPGTTFDLKSSGGWARERALILRLLDGRLAHPKGAIRLFQGWSGETGWEGERARVATLPVDREIADRFQNAVTASPGLITRIDDLCAEIARHRHVHGELRHACTVLIGELRGMLAQASVQSLEPDLIILDEFQRFHDLLHGDSEAADLARQLFNHTDSMGNSAKTLLLSATPYRMLTLAGDALE